MIYMDNAATTKINPAAAAIMRTSMEYDWYNPSSHYDGGYTAKKILTAAREVIAQNLNAKSGEIYFTSGGSEANNWALETIARQGAAANKFHIISTTFEHHSVLRKLESLKERGFNITLIPPDKNGLINPDDIAKAFTLSTCGISIMSINNEVGTIQPIEAIGKLCHEKGILFHTDAVQGIPHKIFNLKTMPIDYLSASGHKFNGPRGIGFLYANSKAPLYPLIYGGGQEKGLRAGTENLAAAQAMSAALAIKIDKLPNFCKPMLEKRLSLISGLKDINGCHFNCLDNQITSIVNFYFDDVLGETLLSLLNTDGIYCSAGSACAAGDPEPSHVLKAIGLSDNAAKNSIRLSFSDETTMDEIQQVVESIKRNVKFIRGV